MKAYPVRSSDKIESKALTNLPFTVQSNLLDKHNVSWRNDRTQMVDICLKAAEEQYALSNDQEGFWRFMKSKYIH